MNWKAFTAPWRMLWRTWWHEKLPQWLAHKLPRKVVYFAFIRLHGHATCTKYATRHPDDVNWRESLEVWEAQCEL